MPEKSEYRPPLSPEAEIFPKSEYSVGEYPKDSEYIPTAQLLKAERALKTPTLVQIFVGVSVVLIVLLFFLGAYFTEAQKGFFLLTSVVCVLLVLIFGLYTISRFSRQSVHLKELLNIDRTTGLYSSTFLMEELDRLVAEKHPNLVLIFLDLDELKLYNDKYGHRAGDKLIRNSAEALVEAIAGRGVGFRYGGDEFVAVLNDVSYDEALQMAKRVHAAFKNRDISASIGVYPWRPGLSADALLHQADKAMYAAKRSGKGRIFFGGGEIGGTMETIESELLDL